LEGLSPFPWLRSSRRIETADQAEAGSMPCRIEPA
jgi:hypothetical protein